MSNSKHWNPANGESSEVKTLKNNKNKPKKKSGFLKGLGVLLLIVLIATGIITFAIYSYVIKPGQIVFAEVEKVEQGTEGIRQAFLERDLLAFNAALVKTRTDLENLRTVRDEQLGWARDFSYTQEYYSDSDRFIAAGLDMVDAGEEFATVIMPFGDAIGLKTSEEQEVEELGLAEAFATWIAVMPDVADNLDAVIAELDSAGEELAQVDASKYPEDIYGYDVKGTIESSQTVLSQLNEFGPDIKVALRTIPGLLGVDTGEKRYMIIMQNDKELRATGGFWTYLATFKINNALLSSDFTSYNSYYIDDVLDVIDPYTTFPTVPAAYQRHLKVERMFARDANIYADLPSSVDQFLTFWDLAQPIVPSEIKPVDGVVVIDTTVLQELFEITGPVTVNGFTYDADNVVLQLERIASLNIQEQVNRKKVLGDLMEAMLVNVFESERNLWPKLIEKGIDLAYRKHIAGVLINEEDAEAQAILERYNLAGTINTEVEGDYAYVVQTNLGGDKTNWFTDKTVTHELANENGQWVRTVRINYNYVRPGPEYIDFIKRFRDWVRVYVPAEAEFVSLDGSEDPIEEGEELGRKYFAGFVTAGPDETREVVFKYTIPEELVNMDGEYKLFIQKQLGVPTEPVTVTVNGQSETFDLVTDNQYSTAL